MPTGRNRPERVTPSTGADEAAIKLQKKRDERLAAAKERRQKERDAEIRRKQEDDAYNAAHPGEDNPSDPGADTSAGGGVHDPADPANKDTDDMDDDDLLDDDDKSHDIPPPPPGTEEPPPTPGRSDQPQQDDDGRMYSNAYGIALTQGLNDNAVEQNRQHKTTYNYQRKEFQDAVQGLVASAMDNANFRYMPIIQPKLLPTSFAKEWDGTFSEFLRKVGVSPGKWTNITFDNGFGRISNKVVPAGVTIDAGEFKGRKATIAGLGGASSVFSNVKYAYSDLAVGLGIKTKYRRGKSDLTWYLGRARGKIHHGSMYLPKQSIANMLEMSVSEADKHTPTELISMLIQFMYKSSAEMLNSERHYEARVTITMASDPDANSKRLYLIYLRKVMATMMKLKKNHPEDYAKLIDKLKIKTYYTPTGTPAQKFGSHRILAVPGEGWKKATKPEWPGRTVHSTSY